MKVVFCDTNKLFGLLHRFLAGTINFSVLQHLVLSKVIELYISSAVIDELRIVFERDHNIVISKMQIDSFVDFLGCALIDSKPLEKEYISFVEDYDDAQILQDAVQICADILLTGNLKDYHIESIYKLFHLKVVKELDFSVL